MIARFEYTAFVRGTNLTDAEARNHAPLPKEFAPLAGRSVSTELQLEFWTKVPRPLSPVRRGSLIPRPLWM